MSIEAPRKLSVNPMSINYNEAVLKRIDKVFVNGQHLPHCYAYDMDMGWACGLVKGACGPKQYGTITVTMKG